TTARIRLATPRNGWTTSVSNDPTRWTRPAAGPAGESADPPELATLAPRLPPDAAGEVAASGLGDALATRESKCGAMVITDAVCSRLAMAISAAGDRVGSASGPRSGLARGAALLATTREGKSLLAVFGAAPAVCAWGPMSDAAAWPKENRNWV